MRLVLVLLLSSLASAQGMGGKSGIGGKAGFGGGIPVASVAFDNSCNSGVPASGTSVTCTLTIAAGAKALVVHAFAESALRTISTATAGASNLTCDAGTSNGEIVFTCKLASPPTGSVVVTITFNATDVGGLVASSYTGGTGTFGTIATGTASTSPTSISVSCAANDLAVDGIMKDEGGTVGGLTPLGGQTQLGTTQSLSNNYSYAGSWAAGSATVAMGWTQGGTARAWAEEGVCVK